MGREEDEAEAYYEYQRERDHAESDATQEDLLDVEVRELCPTTGQPVGEWRLLGERLDRDSAVFVAESWERSQPPFIVVTFKTRIRPHVPPYYTETP